MIEWNANHTIYRSSEPNMFLTKQHWDSVMGRLPIRPDFEVFTDRKGNNARLPFHFHKNLDVFEGPEEIWTKKISWWFPPKTLTYNVFKYLISFMRQPEETRPHFYLLVECMKSRHDHFISRFNRVYTFRSGLKLFQEYSEAGVLTELPPTSYKYVVLASHPIKKV